MIQLKFFLCRQAAKTQSNTKNFVLLRAFAPLWLKKLPFFVKINFVSLEVKNILSKIFSPEEKHTEIFNTQFSTLNL
jgi:hypothetical protein